MKTAYKSTPAPIQKTPLTPRQISLMKLFTFLKIGGVIVAIIGIAFVGTKYGDRISDPRWWRSLFSKNNSFDLRDPVLNANTPPGPAPEGMVWIPGGEYYMGDEDFDYASPLRLVYVDGFWMDKHEVTNERFAKFVAATSYVTVVERDLDPKKYPKAP